MDAIDAQISVGIHSGISFEDYRKIPAVNSSSLKNMLVSPLNYQHKLNEEFSSKSIDIGRAVHSIVLEPLKFVDDYVMYDGIRRGKEWEKFKNVNDDKEILNMTEWDAAFAISKNVNNHTVASKIISECDSEMTIIFREPVTGIMCKSRIDSLDKCYRYFADLKTTHNVEPGAFCRQFASLNYHFQFAFYRLALHEVTGVWVPAKCIATSNNEPYDTVVYSVSDSAVDDGMKMVSACFQRLKECRESDKWPGISDDEILLDLPGWAYSDENEEIEL